MMILTLHNCDGKYYETLYFSFITLHNRCYNITRALTQTGFYNILYRMQRICTLLVCTDIFMCLCQNRDVSKSHNRLALALLEYMQHMLHIQPVLSYIPYTVV